MDSKAKLLERVKSNQNDAEALYGLARYSVIKYESEEAFLADNAGSTVGKLEALSFSILMDYCERIAENGLPESNSKDAQTLNLLIMSAKLGYRPAQDALSSVGGMAFEYGNYQICSKIIPPLAEQGLDEAQYNLSLMYDQGLGVSQDSQKAFMWCEKAALQGHAMAMGNLGTCYLTGDGVAKNREKAREWYDKGAIAGNKYSKERLWDKFEVLPSIHYEFSNGTITKCYGDNAEIAIPNEIDWQQVRAIGKNAFSGHFSMISVSISSGVTDIGESAFSFCKNLTTISIPSSVAMIGEGAFRYCDSLTSVNIPSSVTTIGKEAFYECKSLTTVSIPSSVAMIGESAFEFCDSLKEFIVDADNKYYTACDGVLFTKDKRTIVSYPNAKGGCYSIPSGVTTIRKEAFSRCKRLTSVSIPSSVTTIEAGAFYGCDSLKEFIVDAENKHYTTRDGVLFTKDKRTIVSYPNAILDSFCIPSGVTTIEEGAFSGDKFTSLVIPDDVTSIGNSVLEGRLTSVTMPENVTITGNRDSNGLIAYYNKKGKKAGVYTYWEKFFLHGWKWQPR